MKKMIFLLSSVLLFAQCGGGEATQENAEVQEVQEEVVESVTMYALKDGSAEVKWTAFKLTDKIGVNGKFDSLFVELSQVEDTSIAELLGGAKMTIATNSTSTGDAERDGKIMKQFFGTMTNGGASIIGTVKEVEGENAGKVVVSIEMNGSVYDQVFDWKYENEIVIMKATIDVNNWSAGQSLGALNKVCRELHKGPDGKSVLWPDVEVVVNFRVVETLVTL
jgi:hypothetical protein